MNLQYILNEDKAGATDGLGVLAEAISTIQRVNTPEEWRSRRREIEKHSRRKRMSKLKDMRHQVKKLESQYDSLVKNQASSFEVVKLRTKMSQVLSIQDELMHEREVLINTLQEKQVVHKSITVSLKEKRDEVQKMFRPLTEDESDAFIRKFHQDVVDFTMKTQFETSGLHCFGWKDRRWLDQEASRLMCSFTKMFPTKTAKSIMNKTWDLMCDESELQRVVYGLKAKVSLETLQYLSDSAQVFYRMSHYPSLIDSYHTVYLLFRLEMENGYLIVFRTIPAREIKHSLDDHEQWYKINLWFQLTDVFHEDGSRNGCKVKLGGSLCNPKNSQVVTGMWMLEIILSVVRWENACVGPMLITKENIA